MKKKHILIVEDERIVSLESAKRAERGLT